MRRIGLIFAVTACSSTPTGTIALAVGQETDAFSRAPAPTSLTVEKIDSSGHASTLATVALPADSINLPDLSQDDDGIVRVSAKDDAGNVLLRGQSLPVTFGALAGLTLDVFVQRTGELARMPSDFDDRPSPVLASVYGRYALAAGGSSATGALYDVFTLSALPNPPTLPRTPLSVASYGTVLLLIDKAGATAFDLADSTSTVVSAPDGGSFAEVAGGASLFASDGSQYVVGATRTSGDPTARVLKIDASGVASFVSLSAARLGAAAAWVEGRGLVVVGGSGAAPGVEVLGAGATAGSALAFAPDATAGAGAAALDGAHVVVAGGTAAPRALDLGCAPSASTTCTTSWPPLPAPLARASVYPIDKASAFVVGDDAAGTMHAYRIGPSNALEIALKIPRKLARTLALPTGAIAIVGGGSKTIESFVP
jgi:hypothetical protein